MAAGLIGEGSECYGFDDEISRDHDFGPSFQIYIPKEDMPVYGERLKHRLETLPKTFQGFGARVESQYGDGRVGVFTIEDFYRKLYWPLCAIFIRRAAIFFNLTSSG